jgi:Flp pilus assembly protein TadG
MGWKSKLRRNQDRGAQLVEFAMLAPLLIILLLGIVEFGYLFGQYNEVRHGAHEGARLAAVDDASLGTNTCNAMNLGGSVTLDFELTGTDPGSQASVEVEWTVDSLSGLGLIEVFLPSSLSTHADFKLEQPATNWNGTNQDVTC